MPNRRKVFVTFPVLPSVRALIHDHCDAAFNETGRTLAFEELLARVRGREMLMITVSDRLDRASISRLPPCVRIIATYSVGHEHIDLAAARERGVTVLNTPDVLTDAVAEIGIFLLLGAARRATESISLLRNRQWSGWSPVQLPGKQLSGKNLGIVGMGRIGRAIAHRARAFGMTTHYCRQSPLASSEGVWHRTNAELLAMSQFLVLSCSSSPSTREFLDCAAVAQLPTSAVVVNVSRGDIVKDDALIGGLQSGKVGAAGLDVYKNEPQLDSRYFDLPNVFMTPHIGSSTVEAREAMARNLLEGADAIERGGAPKNRLT